MSCCIDQVPGDQGSFSVNCRLLYMSCFVLSGMSEVQVFLTPMHLAIAMEYAKGGNLFHYLLQHGPHCRLTEAKAQWIFQQLIIGLDYCHRRVSTCYLGARTVSFLSTGVMWKCMTTRVHLSSTRQILQAPS